AVSPSCQTPPGGLNPAAYVTVTTSVASSRRYLRRLYSHGSVSFSGAIAGVARLGCGGCPSEVKWWLMAGDAEHELSTLEFFLYRSLVSLFLFLFYIGRRLDPARVVEPARDAGRGVDL